jgi:starch phosphorylase
MAWPMKVLLDGHLGPDWEERLEEPGLWAEVLSLDDARLWETHTRLKIDLLDFIDEEARRNWRDRWSASEHLVGAGTLLSPEALTIGFARRFATYKRAALMFRDVERLRRLVVNPWRPVQLIFSGKAHPADDQAKQVLQQVYQFTRDPRFEGRIAFLEDYEMHLARRLVQGVDLWLNLPRVPLEASGTSGMKAALNAVPQLGTSDGWWVEGCTGMNGWAIPEASASEDHDASDAERLYALLEREVVPLFYDRDDRGIPLGWVQLMKHALRVAGDRFTARRMVMQYANDGYVPALRGDDVHDDPPLV